MEYIKNKYIIVQHCQRSKQASPPKASSIRMLGVSRARNNHRSLLLRGLPACSSGLLVKSASDRGLTTSRSSFPAEPLLYAGSKNSSSPITLPEMPVRVHHIPSSGIWSRETCHPLRGYALSALCFVEAGFQKCLQSLEPQPTSSRAESAVRQLGTSCRTGDAAGGRRSYCVVLRAPGSNLGSSSCFATFELPCNFGQDAQTVSVSLAVRPEGNNSS